MSDSLSRGDDLSAPGVSPAAAPSPPPPPPRSTLKRYALPVVATIAVGAAAWYAWSHFTHEPLPAGIARSNGRIEAVEIDIATRIPGRLRKILVKESDLVEPGQVLAVMDTDQLEAQQRQAEAQRERAR